MPNGLVQAKQGMNMKIYDQGFTMTKRQVETQFPLKAKVKWISAHEFFHFMQQVVFSNKVEGFKQVRLASNFVLSTSVYKVGRFPITIFYLFLFF